MPLSESEKARRQLPEIRAQRNAWAATYRKRPEVKLRDAQRKAKERAAPGGAKVNRQRVKNSRARLDRAYLSALICDKSSLKPRSIPQELVEVKREQILLLRASKQLDKALKTSTHNT